MRLLIAAANRAVGIEDGVIVPAEGVFDRGLRLPNAEIRAGLIKAHDHLHANHYGRLGRPLYANAYQWAADIQEHDRAAIARGRALPRRQALLRGAWKNLVSGVTHVVHHDAWEADFDQDFPIQIVRMPCGDSLGMTPQFAPPGGIQPFALHFAEGIDAVAAGEVAALAAAGWLSPRLLAVHGVGVDPDGVAMLRSAGAALVWCPTSNNFLFGRSVPPSLLAEGMD